MPTQAERRAATRARLLDAAGPLFAAHGFAGTSTARILEVAGLSRGALYHHFANKREVFEAVFCRVSDAAIERAVRRGRSSSSPIEALVQACLGWLREARRPEVAAILLEQGPGILGWKRARELEAASSLGLMTRSLERAVAAGEIDVPSIPLAARFLNAALTEAALAGSHGGKEASPRAIEASIRHLIRGLEAR